MQRANDQFSSKPACPRQLVICIMLLRKAAERIAVSSHQEVSSSLQVTRVAPVSRGAAL